MPSTTGIHEQYLFLNYFLHMFFSFNVPHVLHFFNRSRAYFQPFSFSALTITNVKCECYMHQTPHSNALFPYIKDIDTFFFKRLSVQKANVKLNHNSQNIYKVNNCARQTKIQESSENFTLMDITLDGQNNDLQQSLSSSQAQGY